MAVEPITATGDIFADHPAQRVYTRARWEDEWDLRNSPRLWCRKCKFVAAPDIGVASFDWIYGSGMEAGEVSFAVVDPVDLSGQYVKVEIDQPDDADPVVWVGVFEDEARSPDGVLDLESGGPTPTGSQDLTAYSLDVLLTKQPITTTFIDSIETPIGRALPFNKGTGRGRGQSVGNMATADTAGDPFNYRRFAAALDEESSTLWSSADIARYLLAEHGPKDADGLALLPFVVSVDSEDQLSAADGVKPTIDVDGRTVKDIMDEAFNRRRLLGYRWEFIGSEDGLSDKMALRVFTFAESNVPLNDTETIPANTRQRSLNFDAAVDVETAVVQRRAQSVCDQVQAVGAFRVGVGTFYQTDGTVESKWSSDDQDSYNAGASADGDYPADDDAWIERDEMNTRSRSAEKYRRVFTHFGPPADWDGTAGAAYSFGNGKPLCPELQPDGTIASTPEPSPFWLPGLRFLPHLPLLSDRDYATTVEPVTQEDLAGVVEPEFVRPFALLETTKLESTLAQRWMYLDRGADRCHTPLAEDDRISADLRVVDDGLVVELKPNDMRHALAGDGFTPLENTDDEAPTHDWLDVKFTLAVEFDERVEIRYPPDADVDDDRDVVRRLRIELGDDYRLDYLAPETVVDVDSVGKLVENEAGGFVRDDRERMRSIARLAYEWYSVERNAFSLTYKQLRGLFLVGDLIVEIGAGTSTGLQTIRTPITSVEYDLEAGLTSVGTDFADLAFS